MRVKLLLDMNIPLSYVNLLSQRGLEAVRWSDIGEPSAKDHEIMAYAREHGFIVLTYDLDFGAILATSHDLKPSVVQIRASMLRANHVTDLITTAIMQSKNELDKGAILTIDINKSRLRLLPL